MIRILKVLLCSLILAAGLATAPTGGSANAVDGYNCYNKTDRKTWYWDSTAWRPMTIQFTIAYRWCVPTPSPSTRNAFAEVNYAVIAYDYEGQLNCNVDRWFNGIRANAYYWRPSTGANYNPGSFYAGCETVGDNSEIQNYSYDVVPRLYQDDDGDMPRWRAYVVADLRLHTDREFEHAQAFNPWA